MSSEDRTSDSSEDHASDSLDRERSAEESDAAESDDSDVTEPEAPEETTFDLEAPPSDEREGSKWASYALAALLAVVFLVGFLRVVDPAGTGLLIGTIGVLFGLAIVVLALRERMG